MKFVVSRGDTSNPAWLGVTVPPSTPGFKDAGILPKGFRFEVTNPEHVGHVKQGQFAVEDDGSPENNAKISKIIAEAAAEIERLKMQAKMESDRHAQAAKKDKHWDEKPIGNLMLAVIGGVIVVIITAVLCHYWPTWFHSPPP